MSSHRTYWVKICNIQYFNKVSVFNFMHLYINKPVFKSFMGCVTLYDIHPFNPLPAGRILTPGEVSPLSLWSGFLVSRSYTGFGRWHWQVKSRFRDKPGLVHSFTEGSARPHKHLLLRITVLKSPLSLLLINDYPLLSTSSVRHLIGVL